MRHLCRLALVVAAVAIVASPALAQPRPGGGFGFGGPLMLLGQKSVQDELKLTEDQIKKITDLNAKQRELFQGLRDLDRQEAAKKIEEVNKANDKALGEILKADQLKRVKQISWQRAGAGAITNPEVATALGLSDTQKEKITKIQEDQRAKMRDLFQGGGGRPDEATRKKMEDLRKATDEQIQAVLSAEQKTKLKDLLGPEFKGEIRFGPPGGGRPPGGAGNPPRPPGGGATPPPAGGARPPRPIDP